jgi:hypothetical protein
MYSSVHVANDDMVVAIELPNIRKRKPATVQCELETNPMKGGMIHLKKLGMEIPSPMYNT